MKRPPTNLSDPESIKEFEEKDKLDAEQYRQDMTYMLKCPQGRRVVWSLLSYCGVFQSSFNHSGSITNFNEGRRDVGLKLLGDIATYEPSALIDIMKQNLGE